MNRGLWWFINPALGLSILVSCICILLSINLTKQLYKSCVEEEIDHLEHLINISLPNFTICICIICIVLTLVSNIIELVNKLIYISRKDMYDDPMKKVMYIMYMHIIWNVIDVYSTLYINIFIHIIYIWTIYIGYHVYTCIFI